MIPETKDDYTFSYQDVTVYHHQQDCRANHIFEVFQKNQLAHYQVTLDKTCLFEQFRFDEIVEEPVQLATRVEITFNKGSQCNPLEVGESQILYATYINDKARSSTSIVYDKDGQIKAHFHRNLELTEAFVSALQEHPDFPYQVLVGEEKVEDCEAPNTLSAYHLQPKQKIKVQPFTRKQN